MVACLLVLRSEAGGSRSTVYALLYRLDGEAPVQRMAFTYSCICRKERAGELQS